MNFNKNNFKLELDKNKSEILLENRINEIFDIADLELKMMIDYYNQVLVPYLIYSNLNPNNYCGYALHFFYNNDSIVYFLNKSFKNEYMEIKFNSDIWKETNQFFLNKKYEKAIRKNGLKENFFINTHSHIDCYFFDAKNQSLWKNEWENDLINNKLAKFFANKLNKLIRIKKSRIFEFEHHVKRKNYQSFL